METTPIHIANQVRELTEGELRENFFEASCTILDGIEALKFCLTDPSTIPCAVGYDEALERVNSCVSELEAIRYTIQQWRNEFEHFVLEDFQEPQTVTAFPDALLSVKEVADYIGCDISTVYRNHLKNGLTSEIQPNGIKKVRVDDLLDYCRELRYQQNHGYNKKSA